MVLCIHTHFDYHSVPWDVTLCFRNQKEWRLTQRCTHCSKFPVWNQLLQLEQFKNYKPLSCHEGAWIFFFLSSVFVVSVLCTHYQAISVFNKGTALTPQRILLDCSDFSEFFPYCKLKIKGTSSKVWYRQITPSTGDLESWKSQLLTAHTKQHCTESSFDKSVPCHGRYFRKVPAMLYSCLSP